MRKKNMVSGNFKFAALILLFCVGLGCQDISRAVRQSGTVFTIEVQTDEPDKGDIQRRAIGVLQSRLRAIGVDGDVSAAPENRITVKLYGSHDLERVKKFLFTTNQLELKKVAGSFFQTFPTQEQAQQIATAEQEILPYVEGSEAYVQTSKPKFIIVEKKAVINGADISYAQAFSPDGGANNYSINFTLNPQAAQKFGDWTRKNVGNYLAIVLDKRVLSAPVIRGQIFDTGQIDGRFTKAAADDLALSLRSGFLPAALKIIDEKQVEYPFYNKD